MASRKSLWANIDWVTVIMFLTLVFLGWVNIYASVYNPEHQSIFDTSQRYGKQLIWIGAAMVLAFFILVTDSSFFVFFSYVFYAIIIVLLIIVMFVGSEINGAKSWFAIGSFGFQPSEFCKFATALALSSFLNIPGFRFDNFKSVIGAFAIILLPAVLILLQNDTGSAMVFFAFVLVLFREGLSGIVLFFGTLMIVLFVMALMLPNLVLVLILLAAGLIVFYIANPRWNSYFKFPLIYASSIIPLVLANFIAGQPFNISDVITVGLFVGTLVIILVSFWKKISQNLSISLIFMGSLLFTVSVDYVFHNVLADHHQIRINELLGIDSDPLKGGYNVNQSKIAIGSGGFLGKGFLEGTQTKFNFVPEQSTDFIFCTVGEEWGFVGSAFVIGIFMLLFYRLIWLSERQRSVFSRVYGYSVVVILFFHFMVNIGMTIGIMPVIGIPLPFFSYGGSSLWSFTILLFIFIRLDASRFEKF